MQTQVPCTGSCSANQLISVVYKTYNNAVTRSAEYQYDALGRRIGKRVDDGVGSGGSGDSTMDRRETFVYDGAGLLADAAGSIHIGGPNGALNQAGWTDQVLFQFADADADSSSFSPLATRYLYGPAVDQIFAVESASSDPLWALTDHQGTPRDWVEQTTVNGNSSTTISQHIRYTAFGAISSIVDAAGSPLAASLSPLSSFTGQSYDSDADLMYYRARWYDPILGKFLNDDPMGFAAGDANVSRYVGNGATHLSDATGLANDRPWWLPLKGGPGNHCAACHPSQIYPPYLSPTSPAREPYIRKQTMPIVDYPVYLPKPSKTSQLKAIPTTTQQQMLPMPPNAIPHLAGGGTIIEGIPSPNEIIGVTGASPCVGVILIPPHGSSYPVYGMHFGALQPPNLNFPQLPQFIAPRYHAILLGAENDPNPKINKVLLNTLQETMSQLRLQQIPISMYVPAGSAGVDYKGQLIWTTPVKSSTSGY